jgi:hypothetical protein
MTQKIEFGPGIFHPKVYAAQSSSTGQGFTTSPAGTLTYTTTVAPSLISGRSGYVETYPYGIDVQPEPVGRTGLLNSNGLEIHPLLVLTGTKSGTVHERYLAGGPAGSTRLNIYKGTKPSSTDAMSSLSDYESNLLVSFEVPAGMSGIKFTKHDMYNSPTIVLKREYPNVGEVEAILGICNIPTTAVGSGVATWFWFGNYSSPTDLSDIAFVVGDVGATDDGSCEMHLTNTFITSGDTYKSFGFKFRIPMSHTI